MRKRVDLNIKKGESYKSRNIQPPVIRESDSIASERHNYYSSLQKDNPTAYNNFDVNENPFLADGRPKSQRGLYGPNFPVTLSEKVNFLFG